MAGSFRVHIRAESPLMQQRYLKRKTDPGSGASWQIPDLANGNKPSMKPGPDLYAQPFRDTVNKPTSTLTISTSAPAGISTSLQTFQSTPDKR